MTTTLSRKQCIELIKAVGQDRTVFIQGHAGMGKTSILYDLAADEAFKDHHVVNPIDMTQMSDGSFWVPTIDNEAGTSSELPNSRFGISNTNHRGIADSRPIMLCFDELGKARQFIKDAAAPLIFERRMGDLYMPEGSVIFACSNLGAEGLGDSMQAHLRDRLVSVIMRNPTAQEWIEDFAIPRSLHPAVIACVQEYPQCLESFTEYDAGDARYGQDLSRNNPYIHNPRAVQDKWVSARSLHASSDILNRGGALGEHTLTAALDGTIGRAFSALLGTYVRFSRSLPSFGAICHDPMGTPVPSNPGALVLMAFKLITQTQDSGAAEAVSKYVARFPGEAKLLFAKNVANNTKKMGLFSRSATFTQTLTASLRVLNAR